jgi:hypothetical protein
MPVVVNYSMMAEMVLKEKARQGGPKKTEHIDESIRLDMYKEWLETYVVALLFEELEKWNAVEGYVKILDASDKIRDRYIMEYLMQVIPDFVTFLRKAVNQAGNALLGNGESTEATTAERYLPSEIPLIARPQVMMAAGHF